MGLLDLIEKVINEHSSAGVMRERLDLIREQVESLEKKMATLQQENAALKQRVVELQRDAASHSAGDDFIKHRGAFFKRKLGGGYCSSVFCRSCHEPMFSLEGEAPFHCASCNVMVDFTRRDLPSVMRELHEQ